MRLYDLRCHSMPIFFAPHIKTPITGAISQCACSLSSEHVVYIGDVNKAAFLYELSRNRGTDPLSRTCNDRDPDVSLLSINEASVVKRVQQHAECRVNPLPIVIIGERL